MSSSTHKLDRLSLFQHETYRLVEVVVEGQLGLEQAGGCDTTPPGSDVVIDAQGQPEVDGSRLILDVDETP